MSRTKIELDFLQMCLRGMISNSQLRTCPDNLAQQSWAFFVDLFLNKELSWLCGASSGPQILGETSVIGSQPGRQSKFQQIMQSSQMFYITTLFGKF